MSREHDEEGMLGEELVEVRERLGLSFAKMAEVLGLAHRTLEGLEKGRGTVTKTVANFTDILLKLAEQQADNRELRQQVKTLQELCRGSTNPVEPLQPRPSQNHASEYWQRVLGEKHDARERRKREFRERDEGMISTDFYDPKTGESWRREN